MVAIVAIIAIYGQGIFAIVAISFVANIANTSVMSDLHLENRRWLAKKLEGAKRGTKTEIAKAMGRGPDIIARIINFSGEGETRNISAPELQVLAKYFNDLPPSLATAKESPPPPERRSREIARVPLLHRVTAGRLKAPITQIPENEIKWLTFSGLGGGDFVAYQLEEDADSMDRVAPPGSIVVVNRSDTTLKNGRFYVFALNGEVGFKMWQDGPPAHLSPYSWNGLHKPQFIKRKRDLEVIGRVKRAVIDL